MGSLFAVHRVPQLGTVGQYHHQNCYFSQDNDPQQSYDTYKIQMHTVHNRHVTGILHVAKTSTSHTQNLVKKKTKQTKDISTQIHVHV